ncbi:MAG: FAD-linked oxidoreductase, partial [Acidimicrobiales bacterium]|nr:FAD-linked oxidoreductase [Acidimicrobiales bacterium]
MRTRAWTNWAGNQTCAPVAVEQPTDEDALVEVVRRAAAADQRVKAVGAGHSFTGAACTDGHLLDLSRYGRVLAVDHERRRVTVEAGITLRTLNEVLAREGLALENMGDIAYQSIAGAISTATHGTGARFGNLATQVVGLRLVTGDGEVVACSEDVDRELWRGARVGVGALGLISAVTIQCVPAFNLHAVEEAARIDDVLADLDALVDGNDHYEMFWIPGTRWALTKRNRRTDEPVAPRPAWRAFRNDVLLDNVAFGAMHRIGVRRPAWIPAMARRIPSTGRQEYVDRSDRVFASARYVRFLEMEYAIPRHAFPSAFAELRRLVDRLGEPIGFPVECRFVAGDDIPLSPAYGRDTAYIAVHVAKGRRSDAYFSGAEAIMAAHDGRPHWGKLHHQDAATLAPRYPAWHDAQAVRR